jgi:hypothetical protein
MGPSRLLAVLACAALCACGNGSNDPGMPLPAPMPADPTAPPGMPTLPAPPTLPEPTSPPPPAPQAPTLSSIQASVFTPICTECHGGNQPRAGMSLEAGRSFTSLVNVPSSQDPRFVRVIAGDPDNSLLIHKLEDPVPPVGARMPRAGPFLPQATIDILRQWIAAGALDN